MLKSDYGGLDDDGRMGGGGGGGGGHSGILQHNFDQKGHLWQ